MVNVTWDGRSAGERFRWDSWTADRRNPSVAGSESTGVGFRGTLPTAERYRPPPAGSTGVKAGGAAVAPRPPFVIVESREPPAVRARSSPAPPIDGSRPAIRVSTAIDARRPALDRRPSARSERVGGPGVTASTPRGEGTCWWPTNRSTMVNAGRRVGRSPRRGAEKVGQTDSRPNGGRRRGERRRGHSASGARRGRSGWPELVPLGRRADRCSDQARCAFASTAHQRGTLDRYKSFLGSISWFRRCRSVDEIGP